MIPDFGDARAAGRQRKKPVIILFDMTRFDRGRRNKWRYRRREGERSNSSSCL
jgi:hypothetical protein